MYEPVVTRCRSPADQTRPSSPDLDRNSHGCGLNRDNNNKEPVPPEKPPRKFQRGHSLRNSFSGEPPYTMKNGTSDFYVDVDQIHIGLRNSVKGVSGSREAAVQTTHLVPYRLRFWPRTDWSFQLSPSEDSCALKCKGCLKIASQWLLSQAGLTIMVVLWALVGAYAFHITEGPREQKQSETLARIQKDLSHSLTVDLNRTASDVDAWPAMIHKYLEKHESLFLEAVGAGFGEGGGGNIWTYPGCFLFSVSLLTTLGFGAPVPRTALGRGAAVIFALVGIPLHFLLVLNVGNLTAIRIQQLAFRTRSNDIPDAAAHPKWLKWFPFVAVLFYYSLGVVLFGVARKRDVLHAFMFPLDFTASGGVASVPGVVRIFYALYLEVAVTLAALVVSLIQASASNGIVDVGLRWGLLTNT